MSSARMMTTLGGPGGGVGEAAAATGATGATGERPPQAERLAATARRRRRDRRVMSAPRSYRIAAAAAFVRGRLGAGRADGELRGGSMPRPIRSNARRRRRSSIAGTGGGHRHTGLGGPGGEARPSPGTSPPGTPDLRGGAEVTVTTGPVSDAVERLQSGHREIRALLDRGTRSIERLAEALDRHSLEVEEVLYPALRAA